MLKRCVRCEAVFEATEYQLVCDSCYGTTWEDVVIQKLLADTSIIEAYPVELTYIKMLGILTNDPI